MKRFYLLIATASLLTGAVAQTGPMQDRALWGSVAVAPAAGAINLGNYQQANNQTLLSWRMLPGDTEQTAFNLWRKQGENGAWRCLNDVAKTGKKGIRATNYQHAALSSPGSDVYYRLTYADSTKTGSEMTCDEYIGEYRMSKEQARSKVPYIEIPLQPTADVCSESDIAYLANDCSVGDLDGDGQMEIVVKRLLTVLGGDGSVVSDGTGAGASDRRARHCVVWDAYRLDGTLLWRILSGPNIILGNSSNFAVADLDGDGRCEFITKTGEGTVFGDGREIGDTDGDGITDYRDRWPGHYTGPSDRGSGGPEFFSVCDGATGRELARADFISSTDRGTGWKAQSESWGDNYWKRANSLRLGVARFTGRGLQVFLGRGVYGRTVVEAWQYEPASAATDKPEGTLTRLWHFDTSTAGGSDRNKDGRPNSAYAGQGNHAFNVADLDGDGLDEVMYGSCAFDDDGTGLWTSGLGHGDANHVGVFQRGYEGLQVYHCLESGKTQVALHDGRTGDVIWQKVGASDNDMGRCLVADVDPQSPGCEFWMYGNELFAQDGSELLAADGKRKKESSANAAIWFDGTLSRQMLNEGIIHSLQHGRTFTIYRYDMSFNNGTKSNPGWYGDMLGDWREEVILPDQTKVKNLKLFSTWYPTRLRIPWLMTDHTYRMQCIHEQVGYNQPTNVGYYLGSDQTQDEIWAAAARADQALRELTSGIREVAGSNSGTDWDSRPDGRRRPVAFGGMYTLSGQRVSHPQCGRIYLYNGKKVVY